MASWPDTQGLSKWICIIRHYGYDLLVRREAEVLRTAGFDADVICPGLSSKEKDAIINDVRIHYIPLAHKKRTLKMSESPALVLPDRYRGWLWPLPGALFGRSATSSPRRGY